MNVVDVTQWFAPKSGGIRTYLHAKAEYAEARRLRHALVVPGATATVARIARTPVVVVPGLPTAQETGYRLIPHPRPMIQALDRLQPTVLVIHDATSFPRRLCRWAHTRGIPVVSIVHSELEAGAAGMPTALRLPTQHLLRILQSRGLDGPDAVIATSQAVAARLRERSDAHIYVSPLGVDTKVFCPRALDADYRRQLAEPNETLLVADALTGQDAVVLARNFDEKIGVSGIVLTRIDGDGRGGAALSMRQVTGKPIKLMGTGEKLDGLEDFHPERIAGRILGMGDVVSLVEKAALNFDQAKAQKIAERMKKGAFDLDDLSDQLKQLQKLGGMGGVMNMLPGMGKIKKQVEGMDLDNKLLKRQMAIISSMTPYERRNPKTMDAKRKKRVAAGSGTKVEEINRLLKMHIQMAGMMKQMGQGKGLFGKMMGKGAPDAAELEKMQAELAGLDPNALPEDLKDMMKGGSLPSMPGLPGLGAGKLPGLGNLPGLGGTSPFKGLPGFGKKK